MSRPVRGECQKRKRDGNIPLQVVDCAPWQLWTWWNEMDSSDHDEIFKYLGFLTKIMTINPRRDVIEALLSFWDPLNNVFRFSDFELTPTLEEITGYIGYGNMHRKRLIAPRIISVNRFCALLNMRVPKEKSLEKGWVSLQFLYERYGRQEGFEQFEK